MSEAESDDLIEAVINLDNLYVPNKDEEKEVVEPFTEIEGYSEMIEKIKKNQIDEMKPIFENENKKIQKPINSEKPHETLDWSLLLKNTKALERSPSKSSESSKRNEHPSPKTKKKSKKKMKDEKKEIKKRENKKQTKALNSKSTEKEHLKRDEKIESLNQKIKELEKMVSQQKLEQLYQKYEGNNDHQGPTYSNKIDESFNNFEMFQKLQQEKCKLLIKNEQLTKEIEKKKEEKKRQRNTNQSDKKMKEKEKTVEQSKPKEAKKTFSSKIAHLENKYANKNNKKAENKTCVVHFTAEKEDAPLESQALKPAYIKPFFKGRRERLDLRKLSLKEILETFNKKTKMNQLSKNLYENLFGNEVVFAESYLNNEIELSHFKKCILTPLDHRAFATVLIYKFPKEFMIDYEKEFPECGTEEMQAFYCQLYGKSEIEYYKEFLRAYLVYDRTSIKNLKKKLDEVIVESGVLKKFISEKKNIMSLLEEIERNDQQEQTLADILNNKEPEKIEKHVVMRFNYSEDENSSEGRDEVKNSLKNENEQKRKVIVIDEREGLDSENKYLSDSEKVKFYDSSENSQKRTSKKSMSESSSDKSSFSDSDNSDDSDDSDDSLDSDLDLSSQDDFESDVDLSLGNELNNNSDNSGIDAMSEESLDEGPKKKKNEVERGIEEQKMEQMEQMEEMEEKELMENEEPDEIEEQEQDEMEVEVGVGVGVEGEDEDEHPCFE